MKTRIQRSGAHETTVTLNGIDLKVEFNVHGQYYPATRIDPAEYPEIELLTAKVIDSEIDILELLEDWVEVIEGQIWANYEE